MRYTTLFCMISCLGCGIEPALFSTTDNAPLPTLPSVQPNVLAGYVTTMPGAEVHLIGPSGQPVSDSVNADEQGGYTFELPGNTDFSGLRVVAQKGTQQYWGLAPVIPAQDSVLNGIRTVPMSLVPGMEDLSPTSTSIAFIVLQRAQGTPLAADTLLSASASAGEALSVRPEVIQFHGMLKKILAATDLEADGIQPFLTEWTGAPGTSVVNAEFLKDGVNYLDGATLSTTSTAFDEALEAAAVSLSFETCEAEDWIRVVFMVNLSEALQDGNCDPLNPYLWTKPADGKQVYFTGGIHVDTPRCSADVTTNCLDDATADMAHIALGAFEPNVLPMYDDGTHGDPVAGDGIWTRSFVMPWIPMEDQEGVSGVRIGYKYTYGQAGGLWGDAEEWPGNSRLLEVADFDGDGMVFRYDYFGDEATNKDKKNLLSFSNGGCGTNKWPEEASDNCHSDVWENGIGFVDLCGSAEAPPVPTVAPVTCGEAAQMMENE